MQQYGTSKCNNTEPKKSNMEPAKNNNIESKNTIIWD